MCQSLDPAFYTLSFVESLKISLHCHDPYILFALCIHCCIDITTSFLSPFPASRASSWWWKPPAYWTSFHSQEKHPSWSQSWSHCSQKNRQITWRRKRGESRSKGRLNANLKYIFQLNFQKGWGLHSGRARIVRGA